MPWCPNCNTEYQEGFTECADCGAALVESLEEAVELLPFFQSESKKLAEKLVSYFQYSSLPSQLSYDSSREVYVVSLPPRQEKQAKKLYQAFYFVERENIEKGLYKDEASKDAESPLEEAPSEEEGKPETGGNVLPDEQNPEMELLEEDAEFFAEDDVQKGTRSEDEDMDVTPENEDDSEASEDRGAYVFKADRYKDLAGTVWIFLLFGIAGLIFVILNMAGILTVLNGWIPNTVMGALFAYFVYVGVSTNAKAKSIKTEIAQENKLTEDINSWLAEHMTEDYLASIYNDDISEELNYIKMTDTVRELLLDQFGAQNLSYLDRLIEEYYNANFEQ